MGPPILFLCDFWPGCLTCWGCAGALLDFLHRCCCWLFPSTLCCWSTSSHYAAAGPRRVPCCPLHVCCCWFPAAPGVPLLDCCCSFFLSLRRFPDLCCCFLLLLLGSFLHLLAAVGLVRGSCCCSALPLLPEVLFSFCCPCCPFHLLLESR